MALEFAQVVAKLVQAVSFRGQLKRGQYGFMELFGGPAADGIAGVEQNFEQADDPGVVDFDARIAERTDSNGQAIGWMSGKRRGR